MRKTWIILTIVALAALLVATPSLAAAQRWRGGASFNVLGAIDTLNSAEGTIDVQVITPLYFKGATITVNTGVNTRFKECDDGDTHRITFGDLVEGWQVRVRGYQGSDGYHATSVIQYVP